MSPTNLVARRPQGVQGRHVLLGFLAFFAAIFVVNGAMIYAAVSTYSGLVANEPYRKGLHYNERIAADERQARLGWVETLELARDGRLTLLLAEADGRPIRGLKIEGTLGRPSTSRLDAKVALAETQPGRYEAQAGALANGSWLATLEARWSAGAEPIYRIRRRLWLEP